MTVKIQWGEFTGEIGLSLQREMLHTFLQVFFHYGFYNFLCNWIPERMGNRAAADSKFGSDVLLFPTLEVKLDELHVYRLQ